MTLLLDANAEIDPVPALRLEERGGILHAAVKNGMVEVTRTLLTRRACVDATDGDGRTCLHVAALSGSRELAEVLVQYQSDVHAAGAVKDKYDCTACDYAENSGVAELLKR